jgi:hypothetical protein
VAGGAHTGAGPPLNILMMNDTSSEPPDAGAPPDAGPFRYHLELTPAQLKITHTALHSLLDGFGHDEPEVGAIIREVLSKLPDEHAIRAIQLDREGATEILLETEGPGSDDGPPAAA